MNDELKKLMAEHSLLRTLIDNLPDCIYVKDIESRKVMANAADLKNLGFKTEAEVLGKTDYDFFPEEIASSLYFDDQEVLTTGNPIINREEQIMMPNGDMRWLLTSKIPLQDAAGAIIGLIGIGRDVTGQIEAEIKLKEQHSLLCTLLDYLPQCVCAKDVEGHIVRMNPAGLKKLGLKEESEVIGKNYSDLFPAEVAAGFNAADRLVLRTGQAMVDQPAKLVLPDGKIQRALITRVPWHNAAGKICGLLCISRDLPESNPPA